MCSVIEHCVCVARTLCVLKSEEKFLDDSLLMIFMNIKYLLWTWDDVFFEMDAENN
jgi:hypothetical protein